MTYEIVGSKVGGWRSPELNFSGMDLEWRGRSKTLHFVVSGGQDAGRTPWRLGGRELRRCRKTVLLP